MLLFPNITRSFSEAYEAFGYVMSVPHFSVMDKWANQLVGAFFMWMAQGKIKKKCAHKWWRDKRPLPHADCPSSAHMVMHLCQYHRYSIEDERAAVMAGIHHWLSEGVGSAPFAGGNRPNFADVCVFGCLKAIDRTAAFQEIMAETAVSPWYNRMQQAVQPGNACTQRQ